MQHAARELTAPGEFVACGPAKPERPRRGADVDHQGQSQQLGQGHPLAHLPSWPYSMGPRSSILTGGPSGFRILCRHAALPAAERWATPPSARRLASASAACHWMRSATTCSSRWPGGMWSGSPGLTGSQLYRVGSVAGSPSIPVARPCGRRGGRPASCRTTCGRPGRGARRSRGTRGGGPCPCSSPGAGRAGRSWAGCRSGASSRRSANTARTGARRRAARRGRPGRRWRPGGSRRGAWSGTW